MVPQHGKQFEKKLEIIAKLKYRLNRSSFEVNTNSSALKKPCDEMM